MNNILFLCTGNYYRSRFAEIYFNYCAVQNGLDWKADSRGLAVHLGVCNVGPISAYALDGLYTRGIHSISLRSPSQVLRNDLQNADRIIVLQKTEHQKYVQQLFPDLESKMEYWEVPDLGEMHSKEALSLLEKEIKDLVQQLRLNLQEV